MIETILPGTVDWTGDNPFVYLKTDAAGDYSSLSLFFRVTASDLGRGNAILVLENPYAPEQPGRRICLTDNLPLAQDLIQRFVKRFGLFRPAHAALAQVELIDGARFGTAQDGTASLTEFATTSSGRQVSLTWRDLQAAFAVNVPPEKTQTGEHVMLSIFQPAGSAEVRVDNIALPGQSIERDFFGMQAQSASLAHSETWIRTA
jgi:hypothetical protein